MATAIKKVRAKKMEKKYIPYSTQLAVSFKKKFGPPQNGGYPLIRACSLIRSNTVYQIQVPIINHVTDCEILLVLLQQQSANRIRLADLRCCSPNLQLYEVALSIYGSDSIIGRVQSIIIIVITILY